MDYLIDTDFGTLLTDLFHVVPNTLLHSNETDDTKKYYKIVGEYEHIRANANINVGVLWGVLCILFALSIIFLTD